MASRSHVDNRLTSEVIERRLRPIYDCLDNGNNKKAIQEADKVLKKQKNSQCAKVLKALALLRIGRHDDSSVILQEVHEQHPTDEATLQAMAICYREIHKHESSNSHKAWKNVDAKSMKSLDQIADMYENAHKARPDSEEILTALFMAYVRLSDHKKQQQTAMVLHKLKPQKNPYYFWAIMSIVMQAHNCADQGLARKMFLPLAERMTKKFVDDDKIEAEAEVQMYLIILELLEKWEESLKVIQGPLGEKLVSELNFQDTKCAEFYTKLEKWSNTNAAYKKLLKKSSDNMFWWKEYIRSAIQLSLLKWEPDDQDNSDTVDHTEEKVLAFIKECFEKDKEEPKASRGPHLAQLEFIKQCCTTEGLQWHSYDSPAELIESYFDKFGDKFCCFSDLKGYLLPAMLNPEQMTKLSEVLKSQVNLKNEDGTIKFAENPKQMQKHITSLQLSCCLGSHENLTKDEKIEFAKEWIERHKHGLQFGTELLTTDLQFSDDYLLLAVTLLMDVWRNGGEKGLVWQIIVLLEMALQNSPSSFQMKLLLIRLYCELGVFGPCPLLYDGMEIKHIMNDTLGYIVSSHVGRLGHFMAACAMYGTMLRFFTVNHKETTEYLIASYKYGSFTKIHEFVKFRERLQNSLQYASATAERMLLDLVLETNSHLSTEQMIMYMEIDPAKGDAINFEGLRDNRDFTVMTRWEPVDTCDYKEVQKQSAEEEMCLEDIVHRYWCENARKTWIAWLKIRNFTLRILAASVMLGQEIDHDHQTNNGVTNDGKQPIHEVLKDLQNQLSNHVTSCQCYAQEKHYPIQGPYRTRLSSYLQGNFQQMFVEMLENVNYVHSLQDIGIDRIDQEKEENLKSRVPSIAEELLETHRGSFFITEGDRNSLDPSVLENLVLFSETFAHVCVLVGVCFRMLKPVKTVLARRNKKKKGNTIPMPCTFDNYNQLVEGLEKVGQELHKAITDLDPVFLAIDLSTLNLTDSISQETDYQEMEKEVWLKVERSFQQSVVELTELLHKKMQYLSSLHL